MTTTGTVNNGEATTSLSTTGYKKGKHIIRTKYTTNNKYIHQREGANTLTLQADQTYTEPEDTTIDITDTPYAIDVPTPSVTPIIAEQVTESGVTVLEHGQGYTTGINTSNTSITDLLDYYNTEFTLRAEIKTDRADTLIGFIYDIYDGVEHNYTPYMVSADDIDMPLTLTTYQVITWRFKEGNCYLYLNGEYTGYQYNTSTLTHGEIYLAIQAQQTQHAYTRSIQYRSGSALIIPPE